MKCIGVALALAVFPSLLAEDGAVPLAEAAGLAESAAPNRFPSGSLQGRIDAASPGETLSIPSGIHSGNLRIRKPLRLSGEPGAEIRGEGTGCVIEVLAPGVVIENLRISQSGTNLSTDDAGIRIEADGVIIRGNSLQNVLHGIYLKGASSARIEKNVVEGWSLNVEAADIDNSAMCSTGSDRRGNGIHAWNSRNNEIRGNTISDMRDGIYLSFTRDSLIEGNRASSCRYGLHYMYSDGNTIVDNTFMRNAAGAALMFSKNLAVRGNRFVDHRGTRAGGIVLHSVDYSRIENNTAQQNRTSLYMQNCNGNTFRGNRISQSYIGLRLTGSSTANRFEENVLGNNLHNVDISGRTDRNDWDDGRRGNYWDGNASIDLNADGVGEWPHHEVDLLGPHRQAFPLVALLSGGPFMRTIQFAIQRSPAPGLFVITDKRPLLPSSDTP